MIFLSCHSQFIKEAGLELAVWFLSPAPNHSTPPTPPGLWRCFHPSKTFSRLPPCAHGSLGVLLLLGRKGKLSCWEGREAHGLQVRSGRSGTKWERGHRVPSSPRWSRSVLCSLRALYPWPAECPPLCDSQTTAHGLQRKFHLISQIKTYF